MLQNIAFINKIGVASNFNWGRSCTQEQHSQQSHLIRDSDPGTPETPATNVINTKIETNCHS
jgi:hypothetical protein